MNVETACLLLERMSYKPGWEITAAPYPNIQGGLCVTIHHPAVDSSVACMRDGYPQMFEADRPFIIEVEECSHEEFERMILELILCVETHEAREFFRDKATGEAPFHPHTKRGMQRWGDPSTDLNYGR